MIEHLHIAVYTPIKRLRMNKSMERSLPLFNTKMYRYDYVDVDTQINRQGFVAVDTQINRYSSVAVDICLIV